MKLNKKLLMLGLGITASTGALAQTFYQCLPCTAGTYSSGGKCVQCPAGYYCPAGASSAIKCADGSVSKPGAAVCDYCPTGLYAGKTQCFAIANLVQSNFTQIASGGVGSSSCPTGTLQPGWYLVKLRGGQGGVAWDYTGGSGGTLQYVFYVPSNASYQLCAGGNGTRGGGGGGSWLKLNFSNKDYYFVAGGGGGTGGGSSKGGGGGGGGIGGGGGAGYLSGRGGGRSGPYAGGERCSGGKGLISNGEKSICGLYSKYPGAGGGGGGGSGASDEGTGGGRGLGITINIITGYMTTGTKSGGFGGYGSNSGDGNSGKSSHSSNTSSSIGACGSSCAILYKLNI